MEAGRIKWEQRVRLVPLPLLLANCKRANIFRSAHSQISASKEEFATYCALGVAGSDVKVTRLVTGKLSTNDAFLHALLPPHEKDHVSRIHLSLCCIRSEAIKKKKGKQR